MINDDFDYPTIRDFFEVRGNCVCNLLDDGDSATEIQKKNEKLLEWSTGWEDLKEIT
ncbi:hypothetical protein [Pedobacter terrae]|uniref:hypothetical protein n=1 Tax=Pedobacter terrae TaxID=405671 RepID=UPI002FF80558